ncbi:TPA: hypothetical protein LU109_003640, partial [Enterobacter hormaechei subsp. xiangfangensis]|nr:hypothetical protein [Enterobacter hormaechei subsp. xiangfangensis]
FSANDARASVKEAKELATKEAQKENHQDQEETHTNQEKQIELLKLLVDKEGKGGGESGGGLLSSLGKGFGALLGGGGLVGAYRKLRGRFGGKGKVGGTAIDEAGALKGEAKAAGKAGKKVAGEAAEEGVEKLAKGSLVKGGEKALEKGGLKAAAKIGLRAIPILGTIAGVGIDAIGGWNDEENLKKNFGDNITTGDRAAQSLANVMDMGGLVSGASNLISAGADALGFEKVAKTFAMDGSNELAKSMGKIFDGSDDKADDRNKSVVDKLSDIVDAVSTLSGGMIAGAPQMPGMMGVNAIAQQALEDNKAITAGAVNTEIVGGANDSMNAYRKRQGWSYNPIARTTLTNTSRNGKYASAGTLNLANNNFGNIRAGDFAAARGGVKTSSGFAGFATPEEGIRAAGDLVLRYNAQGVTTLSQIVSKWAPPNENDTQSYIKRVGAQLGLGPNDKIDATDPVVVSKLISAMSTVEGSSMSMTQADIQKSLGTVKNGNYVGGWTDSTANELGKTAEGKAILANNTGANVVKSPTMVEKGVGMVKKAAAMINTGAVKAMPGLSYSAANAGLGLSPVQKATIAPALNGDALVNSSIAALSTYKPASSMTATPVSGGGIFSGAIGDIFKSATQGISGGDIISEATKGLSPEWSRAISPLTNAAGGGIDQVLNLGRNAIGGWLNGSPTTQRTVTDLSRSGVSSTVSPDSASAKTQENQLSTLEEIASYLEQILGIQKKAPAGNPDATKPGPQPGPTGEIPMSSRSSLISDIVRRQH